MKAIALLSGGLDSRLAVRIMQEQGIELEALNFKTIFCTCTAKGKSCSEASAAAREYKIPMNVYNTTKELMAAVEKAKFGYGRGVNPCIDCRIIMFRKAKEHMLKKSADFIITGEVLGQRPMSQRKDAIGIIDRESGLKGLILRPLSARLFEPTIPEKKGWVDRDKLLGVEGRSRKEQINMAGRLDVKDYPCPAGGCLLTEKRFAEKVKDLIRHKAWTLENALLLTCGRHFRLSPKVKAVVGRDKNENERIRSLARKDDCLLDVVGRPGPLTVLRGDVSEKDITLAAGIAANYVKEGGKTEVRMEIKRNGESTFSEVLPLSNEVLSKYRIAADFAA